MLVKMQINMLHVTTSHPGVGKYNVILFCRCFFLQDINLMSNSANLYELSTESLTFGMPPRIVLYYIRNLLFIVCHTSGMSTDIPTLSSESDILSLGRIHTYMQL